MSAAEVKNIRNFLGLNQEKFGKLIGVSKRTIAYYESGEKEPHPGTEMKLSELYEMIHSDKMSKGEILHFLTNDSFRKKRDKENIPKESSEVQETQPSYPPVPRISAGKGAPYYDVDFVGGFDMVFNEQKMAPSFYIDFPPYNDVDAWINVTGKSMSPFISHGDIAAIKRIKSWNEFLPFGEIYAVITDEHRTIKIVTQGKDEDHFTLIPYNKSPEFVEQQIPKKLINHIYRVKGTIKKFF